MRSRNIFGILLVGVLVLITDPFITGMVFAGSDSFPVYECLKPNTVHLMIIKHFLKSNGAEGLE
jgi:hypothetical protein